MRVRPPSYRGTKPRHTPFLSDNYKTSPAALAPKPAGMWSACTLVTASCASASQRRKFRRACSLVEPAPRHAPPSVQGTGAVEYGSKTGNRLLSAIFSNNSACVTPEQTHLPPSSPCARAVDVFATCDQQARSNPCVACGSARPPTAGPNLDTRPSYQTTTTIHPVRWPPSLPILQVCAVG